jgi:lipopolysaccharide export system protein LptA
VTISKSFFSLGLFFAFVRAASVFAFDESMQIHSGEAEYNGREISLVGTVEIEHELGRIAAHRVIVSAPGKEGKAKFAHFQITDDVQIDFRGGGRLSCQHADIDYQALRGIFLGDDQHPDVVYVDAHKGKDLKATPFTVRSRQMMMELRRRQDSKNPIDKSALNYIQADHEVSVNYNQDYLILADHALYQRLPSLDQEASYWVGVLSLYASDTMDGLCQVTNRNGDRIKAAAIKLDLQSKQLLFARPQGALYQVDGQGNRQEKVNFSAQKLVWDDAEQMLLLSENVQVSQKGLGTLVTDQEVRIYQHMHNGKKEIKSIFSQADTELTHWDEDKKLTHKLKCFGPLMVDHEHMHVVLKSPSDAQGQIPEDKQVYFEDILGDVFADQMDIFYEWNNQSFHPTKLKMTGHVKILNRFDGHVQESGSVLQYVLADAVEYFPGSKEMILSSQNGRRVLLFDQVNHLQMSAPSLRIKRDDATQKDSIQGIGDVRFTFIEKEKERFKQSFNLDATNP